MTKALYCWRCRTIIPMLDEQEWEEVASALRNSIRRIKEHRQQSDSALDGVDDSGYGAEALNRYFQITGFRETNPNALWHHRLSMFGPPCSACGKPLRTPRAKLCAECGAPVPGGARITELAPRQ